MRAIRTECAGVLLLLAGALSACADLPEDGPLVRDIVAQQREHTQAGTPYAIVDIDQHLLSQLDSTVHSLRATFGDDPGPVANEVHEGDYVVVTIWNIRSNAGQTGVASMSPQAETTPEQIIDADGTLVVPFAGRVKIAGDSISAAEREISRSLDGKLIQPHVLLTVTRNTHDSVSVGGDDIKGLLYTVGPNADRILDVIAAAGGPSSPTGQATVQLTRNRQSVTVDLARIVNEPAENIRVHAGDTLIVSKNPAFITALGALSHAAQIPFQTGEMSLSDAVGSAGGLLDERADPSGVFVFRLESRADASRLCPSCDFDEGNDRVPIVYRLDMSKANSFFSAQQFRMADRDVLFVANSPRVQLQKLMNLIDSFFTPVLAAGVVARDLQH